MFDARANVCSRIRPKRVRVRCHGQGQFVDCQTHFVFIISSGNDVCFFFFSCFFFIFVPLKPRSTSNYYTNNNQNINDLNGNHAVTTPNIVQLGEAIAAFVAGLGLNSTSPVLKDALAEARSRHESHVLTDFSALEKAEQHDDTMDEEVHTYIMRCCGHGVTFIHFGVNMVFLPSSSSSSSSSSSFS